MRTALLFAALGIAALSSSCAFDDSREYRVAGNTPRDVAKVKEILQAAATEAALPKQVPSKESSPIPFAFYMNNNVHLRGLVSRDQIEIDLTRSDWPPPSAFKKAERVLSTQLPNAFGHRFRLEPHSDAERIAVVY